MPYVVDPDSMRKGLVMLFCCYLIPLVLICMSAPMDLMMPWFEGGHSQQDEMSTRWTGPNKKKQMKTKEQERASVSSLLVGIVLLLAVVIIDIVLNLPQKMANIICLVLGIIATVIWIIMGRKARENAKKYK